MKWTELEIQFLKDNYEEHGIRFCMEKFGRSWDAVKHRASKLGLRVKKIHTHVKTNSTYDSELLDKEIDILRIEDYIDNRTPILHECFEGHKWKTTPTNILKGIGCPTCANYGFDPNSPASLYFIRLDNDTYKLGITKHEDILSRFPPKERNSIKIEWSIRFDKGYKARELEQSLFKKYGKNTANLDYLVNGNTECLAIYIPKPEIL